MSFFDDLKAGFEFGNAIRTTANQAEDRSRKTAAFETARGKYGDMAGDPELEAQLLDNSAATQRMQLEQRAMQNNVARQSLRFLRAQIAQGVSPEDAAVTVRQFAVQQLPGMENDIDEVLGVATSRPGAVDALLAALDNDDAETARQARVFSQQIGINPATGQREYFTLMDDGQRSFSGITPGVDPIAQQRIEATQARTASSMANQSPEAVEDRARATIIGRQAGEAQMALPAAEAAHRQTTQQLDRILADPTGLRQLGFGNIVGWLTTGQPIAALVTGGGEVLAELQQLQGSVFMQQYQALRGAAGITNIEGDRAVSAILNPSPNLTPEQLMRHLRTVRSATDAYLEAIRKRARTRSTTPRGAVAGAASSRQVPASGASAFTQAQRDDARRRILGRE